MSKVVYILLQLVVAKATAGLNSPITPPKCIEPL